MFSKLAWVAALVSSCLLLSSCLPVGDKPAESPKTETKIGDEAKCLKGLMPTLQAFVVGEAETEKVTALWTCFDEALGLFERRVTGDNPEYYGSRELASFFEDYFLDEHTKINDRLLVEIMRFKQLVVGGENGKLTRAELHKLRSFANLMRSLSEELNPQMKILAMNWQVTGKDKFTEDLEKFENAKEIALRVVDELAAWIEPNNQTYRLEYIVALLEELEKIANTKWESTRQIQKMIPLVSKLKGAMTGTEESVVAPSDWRKFGRLGSRAYFQYLRYYYFFKMNPHKGEDPELFLVFKSVDDLFNVVSEVLREKTGQKLVREEILAVMDSVGQVFPDLGFSDELLDELLKIKTLFLGGANNELTPDDLARGRDKLDNCRQIANLFMANALIYEFKWDPKSLAPELAREKFDQSREALVKMAELSDGLFESDYDLNSILKLVGAFEKILPARKGESQASKKLSEILPLIILGKQLILNDQGSVIKKQDFGFLTKVLALGGGSAYEYKYYLAGEPLLRKPELLEQWLKPMPEVTEALFKARGRGKTLVLSDMDLKLLVRGLDQAGFLGGVPRSSLEAVIPVLTKRFMASPEDRLNGRLEGGFGPRAVKNILGEVSWWIEAQKKMNSIIATEGKVLHGRLGSLFDNLKGESNQEFSRLLASKVPLALDDNQRLYINAKGQIRYDEDALDRLNVVRTGIRWAIRAYASSSQQATKLTGISEDQFKRLFADFRNLMVSMDLIAADNTTFPTSRFMEGNLFTGFSDGDEWLDFGEAGHLTELILSGLKIHNMQKAKLNANCRARSAKVPSLRVDCALDVIRRNADTNLNSMPGMVQMLKADPKVSNEFLYQVLKSAGWAPDDSGNAPMADVALLPHVLQYIETLFRRWDADGNGVLDRNEALRAEPMFRPLIKKVSGLEEDNWLRAVFAYILVKGKPPETFWEKFQFSTGWVDKDDTWPIAADRVMIGKILGFIADAVRSGATTIQVMVPDPDSPDIVDPSLTPLAE